MHPPGSFGGTSRWGGLEARMGRSPVMYAQHSKGSPCKRVQRACALSRSVCQWVEHLPASAAGHAYLRSTSHLPRCKAAPW